MPTKKMSQATKRKISRALKRYHRCARRHKCGRKKKTIKKIKRRKSLPPGYNIHTGKLDELFWDED